MGELFNLFEAKTVNPSNDRFMLHVHDNYEIYLFLGGDAKYVIEENSYLLKDGDIIIIRKNQLHRVYHNNPKKYTRICLNISPQFFVENNCLEYEEVFLNSKSSLGNMIPSKTAKQTGLYDAILRLKRYSDDFVNEDSPIVKAVLIEILYILNNVTIDSEPHTDNPHLYEVIKYINEKFTTNITLDDLQTRFYISKYHLCHIFPDATGLTVHQYITKKRLMYARDLMRGGESAVSAAEKSGFNNYSSFYRAYVNEFSISPKGQI